jgi:hypothetical protein
VSPLRSIEPPDLGASQLPRPLPEPPDELVQEVALPDPRFPLDQHHPAVARLRGLEQLSELRELLVPPVHRGLPRDPHPPEGPLRLDPEQIAKSLMLSDDASRGMEITGDFWILPDWIELPPAAREIVLEKLGGLEILVRQRAGT